MQFLRSILKPVAVVVSVGFVALTLHVPVARAALVNTEVVAEAGQAQSAREHLRTMLDREEVKQALTARGVAAGQVQARVDALTDREAQQLAAQMDQLPAGGDALGVAVFIFLVLLLTDILGFTDIFPFVKKTAR